MISDYLQTDFDSNRCDELSAEIMDLLHSLLSFGFYFSFDHLYDITLPLIQVTSVSILRFSAHFVDRD
jgi:hypothetical protein